MPIDVKLPELGENIEAGDVAAVLVSPGDRVEKDAPLVELETDKAVVEVPAPEAGVVTAIHVKAGDTIRVGDTIASLESASAESGGDDSGSSAAQPSTDQAVAPPAPPPADAPPGPAAPPALPGARAARNRRRPVRVRFRQPRPCAAWRARSASPSMQ